MKCLPRRGADRYGARTSLYCVRRRGSVTVAFQPSRFARFRKPPGQRGRARVPELLHGGPQRHPDAGRDLGLRPGVGDVAPHRERTAEDLPVVPCRDGRRAAQHPRVPLLVDPLPGRIDEGLRLAEDVVEELVVVVEHLAARAQVLLRLPGADLLAGPVRDLQVLGRLHGRTAVEAVVPGPHGPAVGADGVRAVVEPAGGEVGDGAAGAVLLPGGGRELRVGGLRVLHRERLVLVAAQVPLVAGEQARVLVQQVVDELGGGGLGDVDRALGDDPMRRCAAAGRGGRRGRRPGAPASPARARR